MTTKADFRRKLGTDPAEWAEAFVRSTAGEMREAEILERALWVTPWFRDAMDAAAARAKWDAQGDCLKLIDVLVAPHDE
jgi:predicted oxidoreductase